MPSSVFPALGRDVPVTVVFDATSARDHWARRFAGRRYASTLLPGTGRDAGLLLECMGPLTNVFALQPEPDRLRFSLLRCRFFGVPLPRCLTPRCDAEERMEEGGFVFDVPIEMPGVGRLIRYRGRIVAEGREV